MNIFINEGCIQNLKGLQIDEGLSRLRWSGSVGLSNLTPELSGGWPEFAGF